MLIMPDKLRVAFAAPKFGEKIANATLFNVPSLTDVSACAQRCLDAGHCCLGQISACQKPSCAMGCIIAGRAQSVAECKASCAAAAPPAAPAPGTRYSPTKLAVGGLEGNAYGGFPVAADATSGTLYATGGINCREAPAMLGAVFLRARKASQ